MERASHGTAYQRALGEVVQQSSSVEQALRETFCALLGSKYAATVAAGRNAGALVEDCQALLRVHKEIPPKAQAALSEWLTAAHAAFRRRNRVVHDLWIHDAEADGYSLAQSVSRTHQWRTTATSAEELQQLVQNLVHISVELREALVSAVGPDMAGIEAQLRWEDYLSELSPEQLDEMRRRREATAEPGE